MSGAKGTINAFTRGGRLVYEAIYQSSYRHNAYRVCAMAIGEAVDTAPMHPTERAAFAELESRARLDGVDITIEAGSYENGARKRGDAIATAPADTALRYVLCQDFEGGIWTSEPFVAATLRHVAQAVIAGALLDSRRWAVDATTGRFLFGVDGSGHEMKRAPEGT